MLRIANATSNPKENKSNVRRWKRHQETLNNQFKTDENRKNGERSNRIKIGSGFRRKRKRNQIWRKHIYNSNKRKKGKKITKKKTWNGKRQKDRRGGRKKVESRASLSICVSTKTPPTFFFPFLFSFFLPFFSLSLLTQLVKISLISLPKYISLF